MYILKKINLKILIATYLTIFHCINILHSATFEELSKSFVTLNSSTGEEYLCAVIKANNELYAISSQSIFLNKISKIKLRIFTSGKVLKYQAFQVSKNDDLVRFKLKPTKNIIPLPIAEEKSNGEIYSMNPLSGIILKHKFTGDQIKIKNSPITSGSPIINNNGEFLGVVSRIDQGLNKINYSLCNYKKKNSWSNKKPFSFSKLVYSLTQFKEELNIINYFNNNNKQNGFIELKSKNKSKFKSWINMQNEQFLMRSINNASSAQQRHKDQCIFYAQIKRLATYYNTLAYTLKHEKWPSKYLKNQAVEFYSLSNNSKIKLNTTLKDMVKEYPALKPKF